MVRCDFKYCPDCGERLEGMQGPELGLVGESRSARKQGTAEEVKPGERGVGEIGGASELQRHLCVKIDQAHRQIAHAAHYSDKRRKEIWEAIHDALIKLQDDFDRIAEKRSDLSNVKAVAPATLDSASSKDVMAG